MQEGFDLGFKEGSVAGRSLGEMLGCALVRHQLYKQSQSDSCSIDKYHQRSPPVTAPASIITITTTTTNTASASAPYTALTIRWSDLSMKLASTRFQDVFPQQHFIPPQQHSATASITASSLDILKKEFVEATSDQSK